MTCDFWSIKDALDEALRIRFICSVDNEVVLKALFKLKDDELTFVKAYQVAQETEEAIYKGTCVAKKTVHGTISKPVYKMGQLKSKANPPKARISKAKDTPQGKLDSHFPREPVSGVGRRLD